MCVKPPSLPPSPPISPAAFVVEQLRTGVSQPVLSALVLGVCVLLAATRWGAAGGRGELVNTATLMLVVAALFALAKLLPSMRLWAPLVVTYGTCAASGFTLVFDATQTSMATTTAATGLAQFGDAPYLSILGQVVYGLLLGVQPLSLRVRMRCLCGTVGLWATNLAVAYSRTGRLAFVTRLLPQSAMPLVAGVLAGAWLVTNRDKVWPGGQSGHASGGTVD